MYVFILPETPLLRWSVRDKKEQHRRAEQSAGSLSGTEASRQPGDQQRPSGLPW